MKERKALQTVPKISNSDALREFYTGVPEKKLINKKEPLAGKIPGPEERSSRTKVSKPIGMYFYGVPADIKDIFERFCFWEQKTKTEALTIFVREYHKKLKEKEELPAIPEGRSVLKHIKELKIKHKQELETVGAKTQ